MTAKTFKPTWLYVKQHNITGLKYFGKTTRNNPESYKGSGLFWARHLKKYGNDVSTIWVQLFSNQESLTEYAIEFSTKNKIVESDDWANLKIEDGLMGGSNGLSLVTRQKISVKSKQHRHSPETIEKIRAARKAQAPTMLGKKHSEETKEKIRAARALQPAPWLKKEFSK